MHLKPFATTFGQTPGPNLQYLLEMIYSETMTSEFGPAIKLLPEMETHQLCTMVFGWSFDGNVLKVSSLRFFFKEKSHLKNVSSFKEHALNRTVTY